MNELDRGTPQNPYSAPQADLGQPAPRRTSPLLPFGWGSVCTWGVLVLCNSVVGVLFGVLLMEFHQSPILWVLMGLTIATTWGFFVWLDWHLDRRGSHDHRRGLRAGAIITALAQVIPVLDIGGALIGGAVLIQLLGALTTPGPAAQVLCLCIGVSGTKVLAVLAFAQLHRFFGRGTR